MTASSADSRPALMRDPSFLGLNVTQFLGVFNDNLFRQLVFLLCLDEVQKGKPDLQGVGQILFALPFLGVSGFAGYLSDRFSKRTIIVACKFAEVLIVVLGMIGFVTGSLNFLLFVLCMMGFHSAFFGPSKYGILPELLRKEDLPRANGSILMATFLAIIFGLSGAGAAKYMFGSTLWLASIPCLIIAILGLVSSLTIRPTPIAQPHLKFEVSSLAIAPETRQLLWSNRSLLHALLVYSVFWFVSGTVYPSTINVVCKQQFRFNDLWTGMFAASTGVGIAIGCVAAGLLSRNRVQSWIVRTGAWGITLSLILLALPGPGWNDVRTELQHPAAPTIEVAQILIEKEEIVAAPPPAEQHEIRSNRGTLLGPSLSVIALISLGIFAGFYSVPLLVYLQSTAPIEQKGRIIGANNLMNWVGIAGSGLIYTAGRLILVDTLHLPYSTLFGFASLLMLPVAIFYRPPNTQVAQSE